MIAIFIIILYVLIGMGLSTIWAIKYNETDETFLSAVWLFWPLMLVTLIFVGIVIGVGKIPICLTKIIKSYLDYLEERNDKNNKEGKCS